MDFNNHSNLQGKHAFLSASKYHWLRYDVEKIKQVYLAQLAVLKGTELHEYAAKSIALGQRLPKSTKTLNAYVNDAIGYRMTPEQVLYYSDNCFGTADAISYKNKFLRIHDYKSGSTPANMDQLKIYAAIFCLEYHVVPEQIELRIYQSDDILICEPDMDEIRIIMDQIRILDVAVNTLKTEEFR